MDAGNLHAGTCDLNPGNTDGSGHNGLPFRESFARQNAPTKPIWPTALADSSASFKPGSLDFSLAGATSQTHTLLQQNHSGRFDLLIWQETKCWQSNDATRIGGHPIPVPTIDVTLTSRGRASEELLT